MILAWIYLPEAKSPHPLKLDLVGVALIVLAMLMLMFPLIQGRELDWPTWLLRHRWPARSLSSCSSPGTRSGRTSATARRSSRRGFSASARSSPASSSAFPSSRSCSASSSSSRIFLQIGLGYSILKAGLTGIPFSLGVAVAAGMSGPVLVPRFGRKIVSAGPIIMAVGYGFFILTIRHFGADVTPWEMIPSLIVSGIGMGCVVAPIYPFILAEVPIKDAGSASGVVNAIQQVGGAVGVAVVGVIFFGLLGSGAQTSVESVRTELAADLVAAGVPAQAQAPILDNFQECFRDRSNAKDFSAVPESCKAGETQMQPFAAHAAGCGDEGRRCAEGARPRSQRAELHQRDGADAALAGRRADRDLLPELLAAGASALARGDGEDRRRRRDGRCE